MFYTPDSKLYHNQKIASEQVLSDSTHCSAITLRVVWFDRKWATISLLVTDWEQPLRGHWLSKNTCRLKNLSRASEHVVPKAHFSRAWSQTLSQLQWGEEAILCTKCCEGCTSDSERRKEMSLSRISFLIRVYKTLSRFEITSGVIWAVNCF